MLGSKLKSWMESQVAKVQRHTKPRHSWIGRDDGHLSSGVPSSCSTDTSILLGGGSSMGSFTQNLSSPDTGYSTDGYSPKSSHPPLSFTARVTSTAIVSKTSLLTTQQPQNQILSSFRSTSTRPSQESPRKPPRLSKIKQQQQQLEQERIPENELKVRDSVISSSGDSGQGTLGSNRISGESFGQFRFPNICEEPRETEILSDWAPTDEDVDEGVLTPTPTPPPCPLSPCPGEVRSSGYQQQSNVIQTSELPKAYDTLQLLNQCNHVFPLPSCTGPRCLQAQIDTRHSGANRKRGGRFGFIKKLFRRKPSVEQDLPENSRGKPIKTGPTGYWLTPTPNSFRKRTVDMSYCVSNAGTIPKGVKSDIIRLPQTTPTTLPSSNCTPTHSMRDSPFLSRLNSCNSSPASVRFRPQQQQVVQMTPVHPCPSPRPVVVPFVPSETTMGSPRPTVATRIHQPPSFNNYSPIHRLVVTTGVHHLHHHRSPAPESPLVRSQTNHHRPPPPPPPRTAVNPRYPYILSSNQNSPILNNVPRRLSIPFETKHYYASPLVQNSGQSQRPPPPPPYPFQGGGDIDRIYERVEGTEVSDEGDGEGGDYEWDVSLGDSELSTSQGQESNRSRHSQSSTQTYQFGFPLPRPASFLEQPPPPRIPPPMAWGTRLSEMELKLLENETDLKYKKLLWEAEVLLRQFTMDKRKVNVQEIPRQGVPRHLFDSECPQSDPLRRKAYDCWALRRLQQEMALSCASPPVLHRSRHNLQSNLHNPIKLKHLHDHHPVI